MHVGGAQGHVAQAGRLERLLRLKERIGAHLELADAIEGRAAAVVPRHARVVELAVAEMWPAMAGRAGGPALEEFHPALRRRAEGGSVAGLIAIERCVARHERAHEAGDGLRYVLRREPGSGIGLVECTAVRIDRCKLRDQLVDRHVELVRVAERTEQLLLERCGAAVPEERLLPRQVEQVRRMPLQALAGHPDREALPVAEAKLRFVTGGTRHRPVRGQPVIEEQRLAQLYPGGRVLLVSRILKREGIGQAVLPRLPDAGQHQDRASSDHDHSSRAPSRVLPMVCHVWLAPAVPQKVRVRTGLTSSTPASVSASLVTKPMPPLKKDTNFKTDASSATFAGGSSALAYCFSSQ